jgi:hypothetical protein
MPGGQMPGGQMPSPTPETPIPSAETSPAASAFNPAAVASEGGGAVGGELFSANMYIDIARPQTQFRVRYDSAYDDNRPDRADFFYPKCGCFRANGSDPNAPGPGTLPEKRINYQELQFALEYAVNPRLSGFVELPWRFVQPEVNPSNSGFSDIAFGFKYAFICDECRVVTFQLRTFAPTGNAMKGLGTNNWNLEPGLLFSQRFSNRACFFGEVRDRIPIDSADDFAGNVIRYGLGVSYEVYQSPHLWVTPVLETVGWTVFNGKVSDENGFVKSASGETIVNIKAGVRVGFGDPCKPGLLNHSDVGVSYGRALTGDVWYKDIVRFEYRLSY